MVVVAAEAAVASARIVSHKRLTLDVVFIGGMFEERSNAIYLGTALLLTSCRLHRVPSSKTPQQRTRGERGCVGVDERKERKHGFR